MELTLVILKLSLYMYVIPVRFCSTVYGPSSYTAVHISSLDIHVHHDSVT